MPALLAVCQYSVPHNQFFLLCRLSDRSAHVWQDGQRLTSCLPSAGGEQSALQMLKA